MNQIDKFMENEFPEEEWNKKDKPQTEERLGNSISETLLKFEKEIKDIRQTIFQEHWPQFEKLSGRITVLESKINRTNERIDCLIEDIKVTIKAKKKARKCKK